ncbi:MAG: exodeoxyribonuclease III [Candidatus Abawacabacteria bacterium]|nr:exodeoxyribonuclease III [Candidatus Abawacabacteria bacterium]
MSIKLLSWNVNGVRAVAKKGFFEWLEQEDPDILCLQETKAHVEQLPGALVHPIGYQTFWNSGEQKGYSGVATFTKEPPLSNTSFLGYSILDAEGRIIMTEYQNFFLFNVYFPNGGRGIERLSYKLEFYKAFLHVVQDFRKKGKGVIICGDVNTAHQEIDLARPKENVNTSGFMRIERDWLDELSSKGFYDTFRLFHPNEPDNYTWWDMKTGARKRNVGWRIDYFWVSEELKSQVKDAYIRCNVLGSDHCPVGIELEL